MCMHRDSGVGILGQDGTLRNHLCATDLKCLAPGSFHTLLMPVDTFLEKKPLLQHMQTEQTQNVRHLAHPQWSLHITKQAFWCTGIHYL
jgi:hypothetical protein